MSSLPNLQRRHSLPIILIPNAPPISLARSRRASHADISFPQVIPVKPPISPSMVEKIKNCFAKAKDWFDRSWVGKMYYRYDPYRPFGMYIYNFISNTYSIRTFQGILNISQLSDVLRKNWRECSWMEKFTHGGRILFILSIPVALYGLGMAMHEFIHSDDRLTCVLRMGENLSWLGSSAGTLTCGLFTVGVGSINALILAFSFYAAGAFLGISTTLLNAKDLHKKLSFRNEIEKLFPTAEPISKHKVTLAELKQTSALTNGQSKAQACWEFVKKKTTKELAELLNVPIEVVASFKRAEFSSHDEIKDKSEAINKLKKRINQQVFWGKIAVISSAIAFIGTLILLFTPLFPLAYGLLAVSAALSMIRFYYKNKNLKEFSLSVKIQVYGGHKLAGM